MCKWSLAALALLFSAVAWGDSVGRPSNSGLMRETAPYFTPAPGPSQADRMSGFMPAAKECGEKAQIECQPSRRGGRTMCGEAVGEAIKCMNERLRLSMAKRCGGHCGNGKEWVNCENGELDACGYKKVSDPDSPECLKPGAVRAYSKSPTTRGQIYGHVEFVCGVQQFCSVYHQPHEKPWPREIPDACWVPKTAQVSGR